MTSRHILLAGSGRSGTTWIGDVLASCRGCCRVFEPLNASRVPQTPRWGRSSQSPGCYLRPNHDHPEWRDFFEQVFAGRISNAWTRQDWRRIPRGLGSYQGLSRVLFRIAATTARIESRHAGTRIVKTIRSNLLLPWLAKHFPVEILWAYRNPCAVVGSQLRLGWQSSLADLFAQHSLIEDLLGPHQERIHSASTPLDQLTVLWCVENLLPFEMAMRGRCRPIDYRAFADAPRLKCENLLTELGLEATRATQSVIMKRVSSPSTHQIDSPPWHAPLSVDDGLRVAEIVDEFGLRELTIDGSHTAFETPTDLESASHRTLAG